MVQPKVRISAEELGRLLRSFNLSEEEARKRIALFREIRIKEEAAIEGVLDFLSDEEYSQYRVWRGADVEIAAKLVAFRKKGVDYSSLPSRLYCLGSE